MEEGGQDSERTRAMRQGYAESLLKCKVGKHMVNIYSLFVYSWNSEQVEAETCIQDRNRLCSHAGLARVG